VARVTCQIGYGSEENDSGIDVECTYATCPMCGNQTMSFGIHDASIKRCLALMNESCPGGHNNFCIADRGAGGGTDYV
jgi:hypothetical protein